MTPESTNIPKPTPKPANCVPLWPQHLLVPQRRQNGLLYFFEFVRIFVLIKSRNHSKSNQINIHQHTSTFRILSAISAQKNPQPLHPFPAKAPCGMRQASVVLRLPVDQRRRPALGAHGLRKPQLFGPGGATRRRLGFNNFESGTLTINLAKSWTAEKRWGFDSFHHSKTGTHQQLW